MTAQQLTLKFSQANLGFISFMADCALSQGKEEDFLKHSHDQLLKPLSQGLIKQFGSSVAQSSRNNTHRVYGSKLCFYLLYFFNRLKCE